MAAAGAWARAPGRKISRNRKTRLMHAHGDEAMADSDETMSMSTIENSHRARITRPMARNAKMVPAPGAAFARVSFVLAKASSCR
jgi:glycosyltransferase A (GT-A) superfamily protein (DUF2064 family)